MLSYVSMIHRKTAFGVTEQQQWYSIKKRFTQQGTGVLLAEV